MKRKFIIIGCGRIGQRHAKHIDNYAELVAVCDVVKSKSDLISKKYACSSYTNVDEVLKSYVDKVDVVSVCTPNGLHAEHTIKALESGYNVLCEKPMATSIADCGLMIKISEKLNKRIFIVKQNRFNPPISELKRIIDQNILGKIFSVQLSCFWNRNKDYYSNSWKGDAKLDGGTLFTQFSHFIDLLYWMFGDIDEVNAFSENFNHKDSIDFEDTGVVILKFLNGTLGTINYNVNSYQKNMEGSLTVFGEKGTIKVGGQYLNELEYQSIQDYKIENLPQGNTANNYGNYVGSMSNHDKIYENLIDVLDNKAKISTSSFEGMKTVEIIERIYNCMNNESRKV